MATPEAERPPLPRRQSDFGASRDENSSRGRNIARARSLGAAGSPPGSALNSLVNGGAVGLTGVATRGSNPGLPPRPELGGLGALNSLGVASANAEGYARRPRVSS